MANIRCRDGKFQVQIRRGQYLPQSKTFTSKKDAAAWARRIEAQMDRGEIIQPSRSAVTLRDLIIRYRDQVTPQKKGYEAETRRLNRLIRQPLSDTLLHDLSPALFARFRDERLKDGQRACQYDLVLLQHILKIARFEWGIPLEDNPLDYVKKPPASKPRNRRLEPGEFENIKEALTGSRATYLWPLIQVAVETGMRRGELLAATWEALDLHARSLILHDTKNGDKRTIPLSSKTTNILAKLPRTDRRIFPVTAVAARQSWDRMLARAGIQNLHFHDLRHEAISRFFEMGLSVPEVALISGHRDYRMLFRYTHLRAEDVARKLG